LRDLVVLLYMLSSFLSLLSFVIYWLNRWLASLLNVALYFALTLSLFLRVLNKLAVFFFTDKAAFWLWLVTKVCTIVLRLSRLALALAFD
jgi:hypothetical protein